MRSLIEAANCPTIVYVSRTKRTKELAFKLSRDGMKALPYNGKMDPDEKIASQEAFMNGDAPKDEKESAIPLIDLTMTRKS